MCVCVCVRVVCARNETVPRAARENGAGTKRSCATPLDVLTARRPIAVTTYIFRGRTGKRPFVQKYNTTSAAGGKTSLESRLSAL